MMTRILRALPVFTLAALFIAGAMYFSNAFGASGQAVVDGAWTPAGCSQVTDLTTAVGIGTVPAEARLALLQAEGDNLRWRDDGTDPTASVGMLLGEGQTLVYNGTLAKIKFIETVGSGILNVCLYR